MIRWANAFIVGCFLLCATVSQAKTPANPYAHPTAVEDASGHAMDHFYQSLRQTKAGKGKTRILQFGASHTAADLWTGTLRKLLQKRFGDGGLGFVMPVRPWRTYRHDGVRFENPKRRKYHWHWDFDRAKPKCNHEDGRLGLAGMRVQASNRKQWSRMQVTASGRGQMTVELIYEKRRGGGDLWLRTDAGRRRRIRTRSRREGLGYHSITLRNRNHTFELRPRGNGLVQLYGAILERNQLGLVFDTAGINGSRARSLLKWDSKRWIELVKRRDPDLIILAYGTNEAMDTNEPLRIYRSQLDRVLAKVRKAAPQASCLLVGPTDHPLVHRENREDNMPWFQHRTRTDDIISVQKEVSVAHNCAFWDSVAATGGPLSIIQWAHAEPQLAWQDYVHFTSRGYRVLANLLFDSLMRGYDAFAQEAS